LWSSRQPRPRPCGRTQAPKPLYARRQHSSTYREPEGVSARVGQRQGWAHTSAPGRRPPCQERATTKRSSQRCRGLLGAGLWRTMQLFQPKWRMSKLTIDAPGGNPDLDEAALRRYAATVFGSLFEATQWFERPAISLDLRCPSEFMGTAKGRKQVHTILGRLDHCIYT